jgi:3-oxoacyl-[acyl-carrier protein] reductase
MTTALNGSPSSRVAIVTGGSRGVGGATVRRLAARGYAVVVNYLHDQRAAELTVEAILAGHSDAMAVRADVADDLDVQRLFAETIAAFGGVDVVVHTAGGHLTATPVTEVSLDEFDALVRLNTRATVNAVSPAIHRPCVPERVTDVIAYLLSDHGHRITGQVLRILPY